jgi:hypothetical protein
LATSGLAALGELHLLGDAAGIDPAAIELAVADERLVIARARSVVGADANHWPVASAGTLMST